MHLWVESTVHKKSWHVNIQDTEFELEDFSQQPDAVLLYKHLSRKYPGAVYELCYEAGFSGFSAGRWLNTQRGVNCHIVNAADVATSDKEKRRKSDRTDARKLCQHLQTKKVNSVHIPALHWEHGRSLVRARNRIVSDQTRCKNRIWQLLHFSGLSLPWPQENGKYWSRRFIKQLEALECGSQPLQTTLELYIKNYINGRALLLAATRQVRSLCRQSGYKEQIELLRSIPGIGEVNAAVILFELQDIQRFKNLDHLCGYVGLVPDTPDSGDTKIVKGITGRHNHFLRTALVESSWSPIRKDPAMLMLYKKYCKRMEKNKAIIRIAKHLIARVRYVLKEQKKYVDSVVGG